MSTSVSDILLEDEQTPLPGLLEGLAHDLPGNADDLDVHLQRSDAVFGPGDLEVHVSVVVFESRDVAKARRICPLP